MATVFSQSVLPNRNSVTSGSVHNPQEYLFAGIRFLEKNHYPEAVAAFQHAKELVFTDANNLYLLARAYQGTGQWDDSIDCLIKALKLKPSFPQAHYLLGEIRQEKSLMERSIAIHRKSVLKNPYDPKAYYILAMDLIQFGHIQEAVETIKKAIELKPDFADGYFQLGIIFVRNEKLDWAISEFEKALEKQPSHIDAGIAVSKLYLQKNEMENAVKHLDHLLTIYPRHPDLNYLRGECYRKQGRTQDAIQLYQTAAEHQADFLDAWIQLAHCCVNCHQWEEARLAAQRVIQLNENMAEAYYLLGICEIQKQHAANALEYFRKYVKLAPNGPEFPKVTYYLSLLEKGSMPKLM